MRIDTAVFGPLEVEEQDVFHVPDGLLGFDGIHKYALLSREGEDITLQCFQAMDAHVPCFVVFDPLDIVEEYRPDMDKSDLKALGCTSSDELSFLVIAVVPEDITRTTVNLKSPIALNRKNQTARQVILNNQDYPIRFALMDQPA